MSAVSQSEYTTDCPALVQFELSSRHVRQTRQRKQCGTELPPLSFHCVEDWSLCNGRLNDRGSILTTILTPFTAIVMSSARKRHKNEWLSNLLMIL